MTTVKIQNLIVYHESQPIKLNQAKSFALSDAKDNTSVPLNRGGIADLS